ncbi:hypothetical protein HXX76_012677 [Chlamydomonas incerta]|uniref:Uncharacterized protein n=1 Tax=Chlamydomonas incerta TaxID=51695 RepID=A0A835SUK7_CHLIN|nr:hypothetical protein HXX76_012677 [Chlamydomonas incerta]|eukprot:KAG2426890.1 hypothetical protein HXX76_012677 [Chlamydomonas incerta]
MTPTGARGGSAPARDEGALRQQLLAAYRAYHNRTSGGTYCAHAPEPYAAMASRGDWSTELWDVCAQPGGMNMCCLSLWCPCIQYGMILEQLPPGSVTCAGSLAGGCALFGALWLVGDLLGAALLTKIFVLPCSALVHTQTRGTIRRKYGIQSHPLHDFFITWCCGPCALCQEAREAVIRQAAEREDLSSRTPVQRMSRPGSVHGPNGHAASLQPASASLGSSSAAAAAAAAALAAMSPGAAPGGTARGGAAGPFTDGEPGAGAGGAATTFATYSNPLLFDPLLGAAPAHLLNQGSQEQPLLRTPELSEGTALATAAAALPAELAAQQPCSPLAQPTAPAGDARAGIHVSGAATIVASGVLSGISNLTPRHSGGGARMLLAADAPNAAAAGAGAGAGAIGRTYSSPVRKAVARQS